MHSDQLDLPITIQIGRKKFPLNLNFYRNAHYQTLNKMKVLFAELISTQLQSLPKFKEISLIYTLYPKTHRLCDVANICTVVDKFFCDALVSAKKIEDDNYTFLKNIQYKFGNIDKENPRVTVQIIGEEYADLSGSD